MPKHLATPRTSDPQKRNDREDFLVPKATHYATPDIQEPEEIPEEPLVYDFVSSDVDVSESTSVDELSSIAPEPIQSPVKSSALKRKKAKKSAVRRPPRQSRQKKEKQPRAKRPQKQPRQKKPKPPSGVKNRPVRSGQPLTFQGFMNNLAPVDIVAILGFAFLAGWTLWFAIECFLMPVVFPGVVSLIAFVVFLICFILLVRARMIGPYQPAQKLDMLYEAPCSLRVIDGIADDKDSDVKACNVFCTKQGLILDFRAWQNNVPWENVEIIDSVGSRGLTLKVPRGKDVAVVRMTFSATEDRFAVEQICKKYSQMRKEEIENADL